VNLDSQQNQEAVPFRRPVRYFPSRRGCSVSGRDCTVNSRGCVKLDSQQNRRLYRIQRPVDAVKHAGEAGQRAVTLS
jgi:hypothetical protein